MKQRAALIERHGVNMWDWTTMDRHPPDRYKLVLMKEGQSEDFDDGPGASRKWLHPYLGRDYHLVAFVEVVVQP